MLGLNAARVGRVVENPFKRKGKVLVSKTKCTEDLKESISRSVNLIGGFDKVVQKGDEILLKPNFNTADSPPGSSDPSFVRAVIDLLYEHGASRVILGESSMLRLRTRRVLERTGMMRRAEDSQATVVLFDEGRWTKVPIEGSYLKSASLADVALEDRKIVYVCCVKTHKWARFTMSLKLAVGFMKPSERMALHMRNLEEKIADLNLAVHPTLIIADGRKCFISGGPATGELRNPNVIIASGDRIAIDVEGVKVIQAFKGSSLRNDPWSYTQISKAADLGLGVRKEQEYEVVN